MLRASGSRSIVPLELLGRVAGRLVPEQARQAVQRALAQALALSGQPLLVGRLLPAQAGSQSEVPRREARIVRTGLGKAGAYRDEQGRLHAVSLRCTHLGCLLRFNAAERSWEEFVPFVVSK